MSMNKTCPISNFTSEEDSDGIGFILSRNSEGNESISAQPFLAQRRETRLTEPLLTLSNQRFVGVRSALRIGIDA